MAGSGATDGSHRTTRPWRRGRSAPPPHRIGSRCRGRCGRRSEAEATSLPAARGTRRRPGRRKAARPRHHDRLAHPPDSPPPNDGGSGDTPAPPWVQKHPGCHRRRRPVIRKPPELPPSPLVDSLRTKEKGGVRRTPDAPTPPQMTGVRLRTDGIQRGTIRSLGPSRPRLTGRLRPRQRGPHLPPPDQNARENPDDRHPGRRQRAYPLEIRTHHAAAPEGTTPLSVPPPTLRSRKDGSGEGQGWAATRGRRQARIRVI